MRSNYIVIEGLEGAGKTTARQLVVETLQSAGIHDMVFTREPGGTILAEKLRSLVLDIQSTGDEVINDKAEVLMFYAARVQLIRVFRREREMSFKEEAKTLSRRSPSRSRVTSKVSIFEDSCNSVSSKASV